MASVLRGRDRRRALAYRYVNVRSGYGLGLHNPGKGYAKVVGHTGEHDGFVSWAGCLPDDGAVIVVLSNRVVDNIGAMARPLVDGLRSG